MFRSSPTQPCGLLDRTLNATHPQDDAVLSRQLDRAPMTMNRLTCLGTDTQRGVSETFPSTGAQMIPRGVWLTPWYYRGVQWLIVVDHAHNVVHFEPVSSHGDRDAQVHALRATLMAFDPQPMQVVD